MCVWMKRYRNMDIPGRNSKTRRVAYLFVYIYKKRHIHLNHNIHIKKNMHFDFMNENTL